MCDANIGNDCVSNDSRDQDEKHDDSTQLETIRDNGYDDCQDGGNGIWDNRPELGLICSVAELHDDGGEEQSERVETGQNTKIGAGAEPGGNAEDSSSHFGPFEGFMAVLTRNGKWREWKGDGSTHLPSSASLDGMSRCSLDAANTRSSSFKNEAVETLLGSMKYAKTPTTTVLSR